MTSSSLLNRLDVYLQRLSFQEFEMTRIDNMKALKVIQEKCETIIREVEAIETGGIGMQEEESEEIEMEEEDD